MTLSEQSVRPALALFMDPAAAAIVRELERLPSTLYSLTANLGIPEPVVRARLVELERLGEVVRCDPSGQWGGNWWRLPGPEPECPPLGGTRS